MKPFHRVTEAGCLSLVGMAGAGKSTLGRMLAESLGWAHLDTDRLIEAYYGLPLQEFLDSVGLERFLLAEEHAVSCLSLQRAVISTGGSVVYSPKAVARLRELGPVIHLKVSLPNFLARVGGAEDRGLAIAPGKTLEGLYNERQPLYEAAADFTVETDCLPPDPCVRAVLDWLGPVGPRPAPKE